VPALLPPDRKEFWLAPCWGASGGIVGCFAGYRARAALVGSLDIPDMYIALVEDLVAVAGCLLVVSQF
jgi:uncharacterized membrane protein